MLYWAIFIIIILFIAVSLLKINVVIEILKNGKDDHFVVSIFSLRGILKYKYEVPFFSINEEGLKMRFVKEHGKKDKKSGEKKTEYGFKEIIDGYKRARKIYLKNYTVFNKIKCYISKRFIIDDLRMNILIGAGDAHYTAILNGILWAFCGSGFSILCNNLKVNNKSLSIKCNFSNKVLLIDFYCIFNFKFVHIISIGIKLLFYYLRGKLNIQNKTLGGDLSG